MLGPQLGPSRNGSEGVPPQQSFGFANGVNLLMLLCQAMSLTLEVFLHRRFGERYIGLQGLIALGVLLGYAALWPEHSLIPLAVFAVLYIVMVVVARVGVFCRRFSGEQPGPGGGHSRYTGEPRLKRWFPRMSELAFKRVIEPALGFMVGLLVCTASPPLGTYLVLASFALMATVNMTLGYDRQRTLDLSDAVIDQRVLARSYRRQRGDLD